MTGPVEFLEAAHKRAEETAKRLHNELWWIGNAARIEAYTAGGIQFDDVGYVSEDGSHTVTVTEAIQRGLLAGSPEDLSRRIAADRKILELHTGDHECSIYDGPNPGDIDHYAFVMESETCDTVRLLAEGYGWTEETT